MRNLNSEAMRTLRPEIEAALNAISRRHGIMLSLGVMGYEPDGSKFTARVTGLAIQGIGNSIPNENLASAIIKEGSKFNSRGTIFTVTAVFPRKPKYKYVAKNDRGTSYKWDAETIRRGLIQS